FAIKGNESKIHGLVANRLAAVFVIRLPRRFLRGKAVDGHCRAPSSREAIIGPSGRIELQFHQRDAWMFAAEIGGWWVGVVEDISVGIGIADIREIRVGLRVAQRQTKPVSWMQLEVPRAAGAVLFRFYRRILRDTQKINAGVSGPGFVRVEQ